MNKKILTALMLMSLFLYSCSKTGNEYLEEAKANYSNKKYDKAVSLFQKACNKGSFQGCLILADIHNKGNDIIKKNTEKADFFYKETFKYADKECNSSNKDACSILARLYEKGLGVQLDLDVSDNYQIKACNLGEYRSCYYIARIKADNIDDFVTYMSKACAFDFADACLTLGNTYLLGFNENMKKLKKDINQGISYIAKACQLNNQFCSNLADIYISGDDVLQNYTEAVKNYNTALQYYESLCPEYDENNTACRNINIIKSKYSVN